MAATDRAEENARDAALVAAWKAGEKDAGDRLVKLHFYDVRLYFLSRAPLEYEDLTQETFHGVAASLANYREDAPFRAYLFTIARYVLCKYLRRRYKWEGEPLDSSLAEITGVPMSSLISHKEDRRILLDAMRRLSLDDQDVLELYHWQELNARELGALFSVPEGTVRSRIRAATKRLERAFTEIRAGRHDRDLDASEIERWLSELRAEVRPLRPLRA